MNAFSATIIVIALTTGIIGYTAPLPSGSQGHQDQPQQEMSMLSQLRQLWTHRAFLVCSTAMLIASVAFGAVTTFIALYTKQSGVGHAGIYLMLQAVVMVFCRFALRKRVPSDGQWHPRFVVGLLTSMAIGLKLLALAVYGGASFI
ncbi:hypothetical protein SAMN03159341_12315 [Paenibacillus sp. 1_12]|nr:hypothetical protein SAMN03159341_12315 [Paenibacillus sp. 1_12]